MYCIYSKNRHPCVLCVHNQVQLFVILWTVAQQTPLSMGFSRQEYWIGLPFPPPGDLPDPGIQSWALEFTALAGGFVTISTTWDSESEVAQQCPVLHDPMDCSLPGFSIPGIFQTRILEWVVISFSRGSSRPRDRTLLSGTIGRLPSEPPGKLLLREKSAKIFQGTEVMIKLALCFP